MKRERTLRVVLALVGLFYVALIYPLYTDLAQESGSIVCRTQESDRIAPLAPAPTKVCAGAVLPSSSGAEY